MSACLTKDPSNNSKSIFEEFLTRSNANAFENNLKISGEKIEVN